MARVNILKRIKVDGRWKMVSIPRRKDNDSYDWKALPEGRYLIEWWERGKRRRQGAGITTAEALDAARRKKYELEGKLSVLWILSRNQNRNARLCTWP